MKIGPFWRLKCTVAETEGFELQACYFRMDDSLEELDNFSAYLCSWDNILPFGMI